MKRRLSAFWTKGEDSFPFRRESGNPEGGRKCFVRYARDRETHRILLMGKSEKNPFFFGP